jgi:hypothetical protein
MGVLALHVSIKHMLILLVREHSDKVPCRNSGTL